MPRHSHSFAPRGSDVARSVAFDSRAPADERRDAMAELTKSHAPRSLSDLLLPQSEMREVIAHIQRDFEEQDFNKAIANNVVPFPSKNAKDKERGMQSVQLDEMQITQMGDYWERPSMFSFDAMRQMVTETPILSAVVMTRVRQAQRFCHVNESGIGPGFRITHIDRDHQPSESEKLSMKMLNRFFANCGWEFNPRERKKLKRDSLPQFVAKAVRDSLTLDSMPIETEMRRDASLGIDGFYAVDGSTIRLCTEHGYQGDDEIFALQVVQGRITAAYNHDQLIYEPRNPVSDVLSCGYGLAEPELMVRVVTGLLNAMTYNIRGFDSNSIPKGILHLAGDYDVNDLAAFKRMWNAQVKGINNAWTLPVMVSKDKESAASFESLGVEFNEMYFSKWMTFLTSIVCAIYGMSPAEINFDSFTAGSTSALSGSDTEEKLTASRDSGLWPILSYMQGVFSDYVCSSFSDKYAFRWTGLDDEDAAVREERRRLVMTVDEMRAQENMGPSTNGLGDAPLNPSLTGTWTQMNQPQQPQDFGDPGDGSGGEDGQDDGGAAPVAGQQGRDDEGAGATVPAQQQPPQRNAGRARADDGSQGDLFGKSEVVGLGLPSV